MPADDLPVVDHHCHLSPTGEGVAAARRFAQAGGSHLFLTTQSYGPEPPHSVEGYREQFETTERLAQTVARETGVTVFVVVAPYPVDLLRASERDGAGPALATHLAAIDLAGRWVNEGRAVAIGEVGRPHFPYAASLEEPVNAAFRRALEVARDVGCPAIVHCADLEAAGFNDLASFAAQASFPLGRLVKHYARTVSEDGRLEAGIVPSVLARRELVRTGLRRTLPWFLETDFLDDPRRPGAVLDLASVPRRYRQTVQQSPADAERFRLPFDEAVRAVYGFSLVRGGRGVHA